MRTISTQKKYFLSYSEESQKDVISCHKMQFDSLKDVLKMKEHLENMSCNTQAFRCWSELIIIENVSI